MVRSTPAGHHSLTPYLIVPDAPSVIDFLKATFDAEEIDRNLRPDGTIAHAELRIGDSMLMMGQSGETWPAMPCAIYVYVADVDATYRRALAAGATSIMEPADQFYGDRNGGVRDVAGNLWWIGTHVEDVPRDELARRAAAQSGAAHSA